MASTAELSPGVCRIPLRRRDGSVRAWTLVDAKDHTRFGALRWCLTSAGYAARRFPGRGPTLLLHREILALPAGDRREADHINGDRLDNRRANLRICTRHEQKQNRRASRTSTSRFRGVHWNVEHHKWKARVKLDLHVYELGYFTDEVAAARAAQAFRDDRMPFAQPDPELAALDALAEAV